MNPPVNPDSPNDGPDKDKLHLDAWMAHHRLPSDVTKANVIELIQALRSPDVKTSEDRRRVVEKSRLWKEVSHLDTAMSLLNSLATMTPILLNQIHW